MKKIFSLIAVTFLAMAMHGQSWKLYAELRRIDNTIDSFFIKMPKNLRDSIFNKAGVYVAPAVETFEGTFEPEYPQGFGKFIKHVDGIYRDARYYSGYPVSVITINAEASTNLTLTNQANAEQYLGNSTRNQVRVNLAAYLQARLTCIVLTASASVNTPRLYIQYSTDGVNWLGTVPTISMSTTGTKETAWFDLPAGALTNVWVRVAQHGGDGAADPALGLVSIQLR